MHHFRQISLLLATVTHSALKSRHRHVLIRQGLGLIARYLVRIVGVATEVATLPDLPIELRDCLKVVREDGVHQRGVTIGEEERDTMLGQRGKR